MSSDGRRHWQLASIGGQPEILETSPKGFQPLLVRLVHLRDVETSAKDLVSRREHDGLRDKNCQKIKSKVCDFEDGWFMLRLRLWNLGAFANENSP